MTGSRPLMRCMRGGYRSCWSSNTGARPKRQHSARRCGRRSQSFARMGARPSSNAGAQPIMSHCWWGSIQRYLSPPGSTTSNRPVRVGGGIALRTTYGSSIGNPDVWHRASYVGCVDRASLETVNSYVAAQGTRALLELGSNCGQPEEGIISHQPSEGKSDDPATV